MGHFRVRPFEFPPFYEGEFARRRKRGAVWPPLSLSLSLSNSLPEFYSGENALAEYGRGTERERERESTENVLAINQ